MQAFLAGYPVWALPTKFERPNFHLHFLHQPLQPPPPLIDTWICPWNGCKQRYAKFCKITVVLYEIES